MKRIWCLIIGKNPETGRTIDWTPANRWYKLYLNFIHIPLVAIQVAGWALLTIAYIPRGIIESIKKDGFNLLKLPPVLYRASSLILFSLLFILFLPLALVRITIEMVYNTSTGKLPSENSKIVKFLRLISTPIMP